MSVPGPFISDSELLAGIMDFEASLPFGTAAMVPVPSKRDGRPAWMLLAVEFAETSDGERLGPVRRLRALMADDGSTREETYDGPMTVAGGGLVSRDLRLRLQRGIPEAGNAFFTGEPAHAAWMRVALHNIFVGDLWQALTAVAPDFLAWLADSPADRTA